MDWLEFCGLLESVEATTVEEVVPALEQVERLIDRGIPVAGLVAYEAAPAFDAAFRVHSADSTKDESDKDVLPLLWFGAFEAVTRHLDLESIPFFSELGDDPFAPSSIEQLGFEPRLEEENYRESIAEIRRAIERGDVYQVNYTFPLEARDDSKDNTQNDRQPENNHGAALFRSLERAQRAPFAGYMAQANRNNGTRGFEICSASPELFFALDGERIVTRPMKGTAARGRFLEEDGTQVVALLESEKDRAENLMIVDMLRNDLSRIAKAGSVQVERLWQVETYPTLHQMTSTVSAQTSHGLSGLLSALFPCASITGAPKISAMKTIRELEVGARGIYTGTMGFWLPGRRAQFSVAIRTASRSIETSRSSHGSDISSVKNARPFRYGIGSGVVWDSDAQLEWQECLTKALVVTREPLSPVLFESLRWSPFRGFWLLDFHLDRLFSSGRYFDFPQLRTTSQARALEKLLRRELLQGVAEKKKPQKVRLTLDRQGGIEVECDALGRPPEEGGPLEEGLPPQKGRARLAWKVALDSEPIDNNVVTLFHKTTDRRIYQQANSRANAGAEQFDDVVLWNRSGELTETTRANLALKLDGRWYTPPVSSGLLAGTLRRALMERNWLSERVMAVSEIPKAEAMVLLNSVRGILRIHNWQGLVARARNHP